MYAAWEVYVEDGLIWIAEQVAEAQEPGAVAPALRAFVAGRVSADPWLLAGDGWRIALREQVAERVRGTGQSGSFGLNSAGPKEVVELQTQVLGESLLDRCRWQGKSAARVKQELSRLVRKRGDIAHTGRSAGVDLKWVRDQRAFVEKLAGRLDVELEAYVKRVKTEP